MWVIAVPLLLTIATGSMGSCPPEGFSSVSNFHLDTFISDRWYIQQQMPTKYLPANENWCVYAEYKLLDKKSFWGYDIQVHNYAQEQDGTPHDSGNFLLAKIVNEDEGKLAVSPKFLPTFFAGPYWVIAYNETEGYALISGGAPTETGTDGLCRTGSGVNNAGLWVFTRAQKRDEKLVSKVGDIVRAKGFDPSVLKDVDQSNCSTNVLL